MSAQTYTDELQDVREIERKEEKSRCRDVETVDVQFDRVWMLWNFGEEPNLAAQLTWYEMDCVPSRKRVIRRHPVLEPAALRSSEPDHRWRRESAQHSRASQAPNKKPTKDG